MFAPIFVADTKIIYSYNFVALYTFIRTYLHHEFKISFWPSFEKYKPMYPMAIWRLSIKKC